KSIADHLGTNLKIIEREISSEITEEIFEEKVKKLNNPYPGIWIFANQIEENKKQVYYAGQDTRLHTPSLNQIDKLAFKFFSLTVNFKLMAYGLNLLMKPFQRFFSWLYKFSYFKKRFFAGLKRLSYITNTEKYILKFYFKIDRDLYRGFGLPKTFFEQAHKNYQLNLNGILNERGLYN